MRRGEWRNGSQKQTGSWVYIWHQDRFRIILDSKDRITGLTRAFFVSGDSPEWGNWKLVREEKNSQNK